MCLKSSTTRLFFQQLVQANNKEKTKLNITGPMWRESTSDQIIPFAMDQ